MYLSAGEAGVHIVDVSDPAHPQEIGAYDTDGWAWQTVVVGDYAFVADGSDGLQVLNVSDPQHPGFVGSAATLGEARALTVAGHYAYLAAGEGGVWAMDISDPAAPVEVGYFPTAGRAVAIARRAGYLFVGVEEDGLQTLVFLPFSDVPEGHWAFPWIGSVWADGVMQGYPDGTFHPDQGITRGEAAVVLERAMHYPQAFTPPDAEPAFPDTAGHWAEDWIAALRNDGITLGYLDGTYRPDASLTRGELVVFLLRAEHGADYTPPHVSAYSFSDIANYWGADWIEALHQEGFVTGYGDGTFRPYQAVTRAEMSALLVRVLGLP